jgi:phosphate starvation-inducible PhoH-like protein
LAVGIGVYQLRENLVERIVLTRPAIDSGASLGFLPGSMQEKIGPYLTPLFDELSYFVEPKTAKAWMEHKILEICPLSLMRGRTFNHSYVILDEAQNATMPELRMCLTRIGQNSKMIIVGDLYQSDLDLCLRGGFQTCLQALDGMDSVGICALDDNDIVRNRLIAEIERRLRGV